MGIKMIVTLALTVTIDRDDWTEAYGTTGADAAEEARADVERDVNDLFSNSKWIEFASDARTTNVAVKTTTADGKTPVYALWACEQVMGCPLHPEGPDGVARTLA
jgi:nitrate reductase beta subunit